jgi:hypothetical protein
MKAMYIRTCNACKTKYSDTVDNSKIQLRCPYCKDVSLTTGSWQVFSNRDASQIFSVLDYENLLAARK